MDQFSSIRAGLLTEKKSTTLLPSLFLSQIFKLDNPVQIPQDEDLVLLSAVIENTLTLIDFIHVQENEFMHFVDLIFQVLICVFLYCFSFY